ncbi:KH domain-containing protein, partial [Haloarchaeobius iranensis]|uniref:KH domain-containing protein n=1 Tax=Haloarchaeobius iranensis TaxID=996166 RepID=UPI00363F75E9
MADEHQFIEDGLQKSQIDEFFAEELGRAGYGGMEVAKTPMGTQIVLKAEKPGMVIGKGGENIRKVTTTLEERFDLPDALDDRLRAVERALDGSDDRAASVTTTPDERRAPLGSRHQHTRETATSSTTSSRASTPPRRPPRTSKAPSRRCVATPARSGRSTSGSRSVPTLRSPRSRRW